MSRADVLEMIRVLESIADMLPDCSKREIESLSGQVLGTLAAIVREFESCGISVENAYIADLGDQLIRSPSVKRAINVIHTSAGYLRGLTHHLP